VTMLDDAPEALEPGRTDDVLFAERVVLGSAIASRTAAERVLEVLTRDDCFAAGTHRAVYAAVRHLTEAGGLREPGDLRSGDEDEKATVSVQTRFAAVLTRLVAAEAGVWRTGQAGIILGDLMRYASGAYMAQATKVLRAAQQRWLLSALSTARQMAAEPGFDAAEGGDMVRKVVEDALAVPSAAAEAVTAADLFLSTLQRLESPEPPGVIQFPWAELRRLVPYLRPGQLVTVAARPSLGKSLVAQDTARYTGLRRQIPCVLFTLEQDRDEVMDRLLAAEAGVPLEHITGKELTDYDWSRIAAARDRFEESSLVIDDAPKITIPHIRARLRGLARREPARLAIVDYLQLMEGGAETESRQREVSAIVGNLKAVAREFRIPVLMCCQLNRGPEHRQDRRPHISDARETGSVENDSDVAILIHREDFYDPESPRAGEADLLVDKNRNGPRGTATIRFQGHYARFVDPEWTPSSAIGAQA
jgi:replicative DNA helicase